IVDQQAFAYPVVEAMVGIPQDRGDVIRRRRHASPLVVDDPGRAGVDHDVLTLEIAMDDTSSVAVDALREAMNPRVDGGPVLDLEPAKPDDEAVEEIRR